MHINYFYLRENVPLSMFIVSLIEKLLSHYSFIRVAQEVTNWCRLNYFCTLNPNDIYPPIEKGKRWHEVVFIRTQDNNWTVCATIVTLVLVSTNLFSSVQWGRCWSWNVFHGTRHPGKMSREIWKKVEDSDNLLKKKKKGGPWKSVEKFSTDFLFKKI